MKLQLKMKQSKLFDTVNCRDRLRDEQLELRASLQPLPMSILSDQSEYMLDRIKGKRVGWIIIEWNK